MRSSRRTTAIACGMLVSLLLGPQSLIPIAAQRPDIPRTTEGRPELTGVWEPVAFPVGDRRLAITGIFDMSRAAGLERLPYQGWAAAEFERNKAGIGKDDLLARCMPPGVPRVAYVPFPQKFVQTPGELVILYEGFHQYRTIPIDGTPVEDFGPTWMGYSSGRWDGDTLVVTVTGRNGRPWLDQAGNFFSEAVTITERYTLLDTETLRYDVTLEDPTVYTEPWSLRVEYARRPGLQLLEYYCQEGERDVEHLVGED